MTNELKAKIEGLVADALRDGQVFATGGEDVYTPQELKEYALENGDEEMGEKGMSEDEYLQFLKDGFCDDKNPITVEYKKQNCSRVEVKLYGEGELDEEDRDSDCNYLEFETVTEARKYYYAVSAKEVKNSNDLWKWKVAKAAMKKLDELCKY